MKTLGLAVLVLLAGCSVSTPQITSVFSQLNDSYDSQKGVWEERLSLFVLAANEDGPEDLDRLYLIHDGDELFWKLTKADWTSVDRNGEHWIGSNALVPHTASFPTGTWRVRLVTKAGNKTDSTFFLPPALGNQASTLKPVVLKSALGEGGTRTFQTLGLPQDYLVWAGAEGGAIVLTQKMIRPVFGMDEVTKDSALVSRIKTFTFYSYDKSRGRGLVAGPFNLK